MKSHVGKKKKKEKERSRREEWKEGKKETRLSSKKEEEKGVIWISFAYAKTPFLPPPQCPYCQNKNTTGHKKAHPSNKNALPIFSHKQYIYAPLRPDYHLKGILIQHLRTGREKYQREN